MMWLCQLINSYIRFTPTNLIEGVARMGRGYRLGLVIDLTNTHRYYDQKVMGLAGH